MAETRHSVCALDCPDCCSLLVTVENGRRTRLRGDPGHPVTRGFLCGKVARYLEHEYSPGRLLYPQRRVGAKGEGRFERISWDQALDAIAARLKAVAAEFGTEAILPYSYGGTMACSMAKAWTGGSFTAGRLAAGPHHLLVGGRSGVDRSAGPALRHRARAVPPFAPDHRLGRQHPGDQRTLMAVRDGGAAPGAKLYTIDPRRNRTGAAADKHFFINPGSDTALALALMHVIVAENLHDADYVARFTEGFEELRRRLREWTPQRAAELTGVAADEIAGLAREYATTRPAAIRLNYGIQRSERGPWRCGRWRCFRC